MLAFFLCDVMFLLNPKQKLTHQGRAFTLEKSCHCTAQLHFSTKQICSSTAMPFTIHFFYALKPLKCWDFPIRNKNEQGWPYFARGCCNRSVSWHLLVLSASAHPERAHQRLPVGGKEEEGFL